MTNLMTAARAAAVDLAMTLVDDERLIGDERAVLIDYLTGEGQSVPRSCLRWEMHEAVILEACRNLLRATRPVTS